MEGQLYKHHAKGGGAEVVAERGEDLKGHGYCQRLRWPLLLAGH